MESGSAEAQGACYTTPLLVKHPPQEETLMVKPIAPPIADDGGPTLPGPVDPPLERDTTVLSTKPEAEVPRDLPTGQATSPIKAVTTASMVGLSNSTIPSNQTEEERRYILVVTALVRRLNLEAMESSSGTW